MLKVSIIIPVYNVEKYLKQCLDSVIKQTLKEIEIICINDGSTDSSLAILECYAQYDQRIKIINKVNTGYGHSMNLGLKEASGEYVGIVESDDFVDTMMFEKLYVSAVSNDIEVVKSNYFAYKNGEESFCESFQSLIYGKIFIPNQVQKIFYKPPSIWSAIYKRKFLLENNICFNETIGASYQDIAFNFKVLACAKRMFLLKEAFLHYRTDNVNSSVNSKAKVYCVCDEYAEIQRFLEERVDLREKLKFLVENLKYKTYQWNYERLSIKYKLEFLIRMADEIILANKKGLLDKAYWASSDWDSINICDLSNSSKEEWVYTTISLWQKRRMYSQAFLDEINKFDKIAIYGAGLVGQSVAKYLKKKGIPIYSFIVSSINGDESTVLDIPVQAIDTFDKLKIDKSQIVVLAAVKESDQVEIMQKIYKHDFEHVIAINLELRKHLE